MTKEPEKEIPVMVMRTVVTYTDGRKEEVVQDLSGDSTYKLMAYGKDGCCEVEMGCNGIRK